MIGIHELKIANCFVAKLVNNPDINCVSRLAFDDFNSHGRSPRLIQRFLNSFSRRNPQSYTVIFCVQLLFGETCFCAKATNPTGSRMAHTVANTAVSKGEIIAENTGTDDPEK
jgi:hypothetical protein